MYKLLKALKLLLLIMAFGLTSNIVFAQLAKGNVLITGDLAVNTKTNKETGNFGSNVTKTRSFSIIPNVSYFVTDRLAIGLALGYGRTSIKEENNPSNSVPYLNTIVTKITLGPIVRYFIPLGKKFYFYGEGGFNMEFNNRDYYVGGLINFENPTQDGIRFKANTVRYNIGIRPGITYFLNNRFALDASFGLLGIQNETEKQPENKYKTTEFIFSFIPNSLTFGLSYRFGGTGN